MRYHLTTVRMAIIKKTTDNKGKDEGERGPSNTTGVNERLCNHRRKQNAGSLQYGCSSKDYNDRTTI